MIKLNTLIIAKYNRLFTEVCSYYNFDMDKLQFANDGLYIVTWALIRCAAPFKTEYTLHLYCKRMYPYIEPFMVIQYTAFNVEEKLLDINEAVKAMRTQKLCRS